MENRADETLIDNLFEAVWKDGYIENILKASGNWRSPTPIDNDDIANTVLEHADVDPDDTAQTDGKLETDIKKITNANSASFPHIADDVNDRPMAVQDDVETTVDHEGEEETVESDDDDDDDSDAGTAPPPDRTWQLLTFVARSVMTVQSTIPPMSLDDVLAALRAELARIAPSHPHRYMLLYFTAQCLYWRHQEAGFSADLDESIVAWRDVLALPSTADHEYRAEFLWRLADALAARSRTAVASAASSVANADLDDAIATRRSALALLPSGHPHRPANLANLAHELVARVGLTGQGADLDGAIVAQREALAVLRCDDNTMYILLNRFLQNLIMRHERTRQLADVEEIIVTCHRKIFLLPWDHPDLPRTLFSLVQYSLFLFQKTKRTCHLHELVAALRRLLYVLEPKHPLWTKTMASLSNALAIQFEREHQFGDLEEAIRLARRILSIIPQYDTLRSDDLCRLGTQLLIRFQHTSRNVDVNEAISVLRDAQARCGNGPNDPRIRCRSLAIALGKRHKRTGNIHDLDEAIITWRTGVAQLAHRKRESDLDAIFEFEGFLALYLTERFRQTLAPADLDAAIVGLSRSLTILPTNQRGRRANRLITLASALRTRYEKTENVVNLNEAIVVLRNAAALLPPGDPTRSRASTMLAELMDIRSGLPSAVMEPGSSV